MENFLTISDFIGLIHIDESNQRTPAGEGVETHFNNVVAQVQEKYLKKLLGVDLYLAFESGLSEVTPLDKWLNLRDGGNVQTTINEKTYTIDFAGCKNMLKGFVYFYFQRHCATNASRSGNFVNISENKYPVNFSSQLSEPFNTSSYLFGFDWDCIFIEYQNSYKLNEFFLIYNSISLLNEKTKPTAYNFIKYSNEVDNTTYEDWVFRYCSKTNHFSI